jgi:hypothetical protein
VNIWTTTGTGIDISEAKPYGRKTLWSEGNVYYQSRYQTPLNASMTPRFQKTENGR